MNIIFSEGKYMVVERITELETYYTVYNGEYFFTTAEKPVLTLEALKQDMQEYILLREESLEE